MEPEEETSYRPSPRGPSRRRFLKLAAGVGGVAALGVLGGRLLLSQGEEVPMTPDELDYLDTLNANIRSGGPGKDGIPSIDNPTFISRAKADEFLRPTDVVFGIDMDGDVRAYPQRVLVWHEIVNDSFGGRKVSVTYCPLTGSQVGLEGASTFGSPLTFGTTGNLVNSNLLMYDRQTDSNWPQILGTAINGERKGQTLSEIPLIWTTWQLWRSKHPNTQVLSTDTGFVRNYDSDPYGFYDPGPGGYYSSSRLWFPVINRSDRFPLKKVVFGVKAGEERLAVPLEEFRSVVVDNYTLSGVPLTLLYEGQLDTLRAFRGDVEDRILTFVQRDGQILDEETESVWSPEGRAIEGTYQGTALRRVSAFNVMWFAWYAFYPDTLVYA